MRIAIHNITSGGMSNGYRKFLKNIIPRLSVHPSVSKLLVTVPEDINIKLKHSYSNVHWHKYSRNWLSRSVNQKIYRVLEAFSPDIIFMPTARTFNYKNVPVVTMLQNMEPIAYRGSNPMRERIINRMRAREAYRSLAVSTRVIAISRFVKETLIRKMKIGPERIGTVYYGSNDINGGEMERPEIVPAGWDRRFLFTAGSIRPARGLKDLLMALNAVKSVPGISGLVIAGETPPRMGSYYNRLNRFIQKHGLDDRVCFPRFLDREEMMWCYQNCLAFVMTSRVEACPNIALEAMSHGCISISSDSPPMPEIFGEAAFYYSIKKKDDLSESMQKVPALTSDKRKELSETAKGRASKFSWDACADKIVSELAKAVAGGK